MYHVNSANLVPLPNTYIYVQQETNKLRCTAETKTGRRKRRKGMGRRDEEKELEGKGGIG
jgi:hypothetical protein